MGNKWTTLSILYIMKLKHITLGKILCVHRSRSKYNLHLCKLLNDIWTHDIKCEPWTKNWETFSVIPFYQDFISCSCRTAHSLPYSFRTNIIQWSRFLPYRCTTMPVNPALRIHVQGQPGLYEFEAIWPIEGQPISKIQKEISDKEFKS